MTYLVGIKVEGTTILAADSLFSFHGSSRDPIDAGLKSGLFFPGCIYAYTGEVQPARDFIRFIKREVTGTNSIPGFWNAFVNLVDSYPFSINGDGFKLLLSTRGSGDPQFWVFDARTRALSPGGNFVTLGTGREILDELVRPIADSDFALLRSGIPNELGAVPYVIGGMLCTRLMEIVQGFESSFLRSKGVGGFFHYAVQTKSEELGQVPSVYVISSFNDGRISSWVYRIAFALGALVVESPIDNTRHIITDTATWPGVENWTPSELERAGVLVNTEISKQPFFNFCGFGSVDPKYRQLSRAIFSTDNLKFDRDWVKGAEYKALVHSLFFPDRHGLPGNHV